MYMSSLSLTRVLLDAYHIAEHAGGVAHLILLVLQGKTMRKALETVMQRRRASCRS